jgi:transcriptional regulator GlxA family with amidase domain
VAGSARFKFKSPSLPAHAALTTAAVALQTLGGAQEAHLDGAVYGLIESAVGLLAGVSLTEARLRPVDQKRISKVLRYLEQAETHASVPELAAIASMSQYHFLRIFRRVTGTTPHQYVLAMRLRRAALKLANTREPIAQLALGTGFEDVSTFNRYFRRTFALTPSAYRSKYFRSAA